MLPALAGMSPHFAAQLAQLARAPRASGDEPRDVVLYMYAIKCSPR